MKQLKIIQYVCCLSSIGIWTYGWIRHNLNIVVLGILVFFIQNVIFAFEKIKERIIFLVFHGAIFTFLLSRPIIGMFERTEWWNRSSQSMENVYFALLIISLSLVGLFLGAEFISWYMSSVKDRPLEMGQEKKDTFVSIFRIIAICMFIITVGFHFVQELEKLFFVRGNSYVEYYSKFKSILPWYMHTLAGFMPYSLCLYLATLPSKKQSFIPLGIYWLSAIPTLLTGVRNPIVLNSIFVFLYYFLRDVLGDKEKWIGRIEKIILSISAPFMIVFMFLYAYIRAGVKINLENPLSMIKDFFIAQGTTFDFVIMSYGRRANLPSFPWRNYTFGGIIDYILYGRIGQVLFGTEPLPDGNNMIRARWGNNLSHHLSYEILKERYLEGEGVGSSYILENYLDFGYIGVLLFSVILGMLFVASIYWLKKNILIRTLILVALTTLFFAPRAEATGWLTYIITIRFWLCVAICYLGASICIKSDWLRKSLKKIFKNI